MASAVTTPLERQFGQMPVARADDVGVAASPARRSRCSSTLDRDIDAAEQDVQAAINAASNLLPRTLPAPPTYSKSNPADTPVLTLARQLGHAAARRRSTTTPTRSWRRRSRRSSGVGLVTLNGGQKPAVRVQVDPDGARRAPGSALEDVRAGAGRGERQPAQGQPRRPAPGLHARRPTTSSPRPPAFAPLIIAYKNGAPVRLARRRRGRSTASRTRSSPAGPTSTRAIILNVQRQPGANVIEVADRVKALLPQLAASLPQGDRRRRSSPTAPRRCAPRSTTSSSRWCSRSCLVVAVIYLFLRSLRATIIPGVAVPLSLIGTFGVM